MNIYLTSYWIVTQGLHAKNKNLEPIGGCDIKEYRTLNDALGFINDIKAVPKKDKSLIDECLDIDTESITILEVTYDFESMKIIDAKEVKEFYHTIEPHILEYVDYKLTRQAMHYNANALMLNAKEEENTIDEFDNLEEARAALKKEKGATWENTSIDDLEERGAHEHVESLAITKYTYDVSNPDVPTDGWDVEEYYFKGVK